jgi:hypothetical protein
MRVAAGRCGLCVVFVALLVLGVGVSGAWGASPWWRLQSGARPSYLPPASEEEGRVIPGKGEIVVSASNLGDASTSGAVTITDRLPADVKAISAEGRTESSVSDFDEKSLECEIKNDPEAPSTIVCTLQGTYQHENESAGKYGPFLPITVVPYEELEDDIGVEVLRGARVCEPSSAACGENEVSVSGGGAPSVSIRRPVTVSEKPVPFGVESYEVTPEEEGGGPTVQAGKHPFQVTGTLTLNEPKATSFNEGGGKVKVEPHPVALPKDLAGLLPPGLIGNPQPFPQCRLSQFTIHTCPQQTAVGVAMIGIVNPLSKVPDMVITPIYIMEPAHGEPARFAFNVTTFPVFVDAHVRSGEDYGVTLSTSDISQIASVLSYKLTFWGVPGAASHDSARGGDCIYELHESREIGLNYGYPPCEPLEERNPPPLLTMPTSCGTPLRTSAEADSWVEAKPEGQRPIYPETAPMPTLVGCNRLPFEPSIKLTPDGTAGSTPTGMNVDVHVDQESVLNGSSLAEATVRDTTVALPEGVALDPSGGGGLEACPEGLIGYEGVREFETSPGVKRPAFTPRLPGSFRSTEPCEPSFNFCSNASKIGTVKVRTPLLPNPLEGAIYLATQEENPFGSLLAMYFVAEDPVSGTLIKIPGSVHLDEATGQVVATFDNTPPLPFEDLEAHFFGGERAPLATPARCGPYTTNAAFLPWAAEPQDEAADAPRSSSTFEVTSGPHGAPCPGASLPFEPSLTAGTTSIQAGGFTPFTMTMSRPDGQQHLQAIQLKMPPGLSGILKGVELCGEPQADEGTCGPNSQIGETTVSVGVGGQPFSVKGGRVYLTGPYNGAPFGLSIVNPAKAGPFDLEHTQAKHPACDCLVVRAKIEVNPETAQLTITSDNEGPYKIPTILEGIPLQIQHVNVIVDRPGFTFNPTDCEKLAITGTLTSTEGSSEALSVPFQATNCAVLAFKPSLTASVTPAKSQRLEGTSFTVKLGYPAGPYDANIARVKVELPKDLPSRLPTLQKACTAAVFEANPAACPPASIIGHATATTPELPVSLSGPAYFVSHGGEAFPSLIIVLQGYGVTVHLVGTTFISKQGITSSTFKTVPDAPVGTFELTLPAGPYSALTGLGNLCRQKLAMPTEFVGQNGALIQTTTKIAVAGCGKVRKATHKKKRHHKKAKGRKASRPGRGGRRG